MKLTTVLVCLLLFFSLKPSNQLNQERISRVENGLLPAVLIKGEPVTTMKLDERMKFYHVKGVSIAVINNGKIEWAKGYGVSLVATGEPLASRLTA